MAILNFPDNPQLNDQYTGDNGTTYIFDGVKWVGHAVAQPAGTNSITNNGHTLQINGDGNLIIPTGAHIYYQDGTALPDAQGPQGPKGDTGPGATVDVGNVTTGIAGSGAFVSNIGTPTAAVFEFTIPRGDKGDRGPAGTNGLNGVGDPGPAGDPGPTGPQGVSVTLQGTKATIADLPLTGNPGDGWIVTTGDGGTHLDGSLWFWNIADQVWNDIGKIVGPQGDRGPSGQRGLTGNNGANGQDGAGVATGGVANQILAKIDDTDFNTHWVTNDRLTNDNGDQVVMGPSGQLTLPKDTGTSADATIGATWNIRLNANGTFYAFASDGYMEIPGDVRAQQGNDLILKAFNPTIDGVPGGVTISLQNRDADTNNRTTQFNLGPSDAVLTTDFSGAENNWTFAHDGSLTVPTNGRVNFGQPTLREPSWGSKNELITLYDFNTPGQVNFGIGVSDHTIWMSTDSSLAGFKWFGGEGNVTLELSGTGVVTTHGTIKGNNGNANLNLTNNAYLSPVTDDFSALYMSPNDTELYSQGTINLYTGQARTNVQAINISTSNDNVLVFNITDWPDITQVTGGWTLYFNDTNYYVQNIQTDTPSAGLITISVNGNISVGQYAVTFLSQLSYNDWIFQNDGSLQLPRGTQLTEEYWSTTITNISLGTETGVTLTANEFNYPEQGQITISDVVGTTQINRSWYYVARANNALELFNDESYNQPVDSSGWTPYVSGGTVTLITEFLIQTSSYSTWKFSQDGSLTVPGKLILSESSGAYIESGMGFHINAPEPISIESVDLTNPASPVSHAWVFGTDGRLMLPNQAVQKDTSNVTCSPTVDTVIYTGTDQYQMTFKLLIKVEGNEVAMDRWETQSTEMIIAKSFQGDKVAASAYGVVHTSIDPLATFSARWNPIINRVEVLCRPTSPTYYVVVRTFATELTTSD